MGRRIESLLVANRGEIATRIIDAARAMGVATVAVFSDADERLPFVARADRAVRLPGVTPVETYLRGDRLIEIALAHDADAIHPGYGFLSEQAAFASACVDAGLAFVGPPPDAIARMGSKVEAKQLMAAAGVPVLPGVTLPGSAAPDALLAAAESVGYPVIVKASAGGGGRGMRIVHDPANLVDAVASAEREAVGAFGDGTLFLERYVEAPRHVEVQIVADEHGAVATLFERDCSVQRRHQKILEEAPTPALSPEARADLAERAVRAVVSAGYENVGTLEFLVDGDGNAYFIEINCRIQVEHPVTEMLTGIDLVALQIGIAAGEPLGLRQSDIEIRGHAIEFRINAEDPAADFRPGAGVIERYHAPGGPWIRMDSHLYPGYEVPPYYDSLLGKLVVWGPDRETAIARGRAALEELLIEGVTTNVEIHRALLENDTFLEGRMTTNLLDRVGGAAFLAAAAAGARG
jgi:acetyl-CoA carboxylase biotin carboxylase subunit